MEDNETARYTAEKIEGLEWGIRDDSDDTLVRTEGGHRVYTGPQWCAEWAAGILNRHEARKLVAAQ